MDALNWRSFPTHAMIALYLVMHMVRCESAMVGALLCSSASVKWLF
jgi:hypothetical protein